jgi:hypothetical protein
LVEGVPSPGPICFFDRELRAECRKRLDAVKRQLSGDMALRGLPGCVEVAGNVLGAPVRRGLEGVKGELVKGRKRAKSGEVRSRGEAVGEADGRLELRQLAWMDRSMLNPHSEAIRAEREAEAGLDAAVGR